MKELIWAWEFWVAMAFGALVKLAASPRLTVLGALVTITSAVGAGLLFTQPTLHFFDLDPATYGYAIAALWAVSGEHIARQLLEMNISDLIRSTATNVITSILKSGRDK